MTNLKRRDALTILSSMAAMAVLPLDALAIGYPQSTGDQAADLAVSRSYAFDSLAQSKNATGAYIPVLHGVLPTGEGIELHETVLLPGHMPHPPHRHKHTELMLIREGTLEFDNDGKLERVTAGGVVFAASNVMHGLKNVGEANANYFVISVGRDG